MVWFVQGHACSALFSVVLHEPTPGSCSPDSVGKMSQGLHPEKGQECHIPREMACY